MTSKQRALPRWLTQDSGQERKAYTRSMVSSRPELDRSADARNNAPQRCLRSNSVKSSEPENVIKTPELPLVEFKGTLKYAVDTIEIACLCDEIRQWVDDHKGGFVPIAFDMEWPFSFQTGPGKTSVIQLCYDENCCYVFHVFHLKRIPAALVELLIHSKVKLHGVNIKNDFRKLKRDFPDISEDKLNIMMQQCVELGKWCNEVYNTSNRWSLERLAHYICKVKISKDKSVRMSKWHRLPLSDQQKIYAATDVYISQVIYRNLEKKEEENLVSLIEFI